MALDISAYSLVAVCNHFEELLTEDAELQKMWILRKVLHPMDELAAIEFLLNKLQDTKTNAQFFEAMKR